MSGLTLTPLLLGGTVVLIASFVLVSYNRFIAALQGELANTEDRIAAGRRFYNGNVRAFNTRVESVPSNIVAGMFSFTQFEYFEIEDPQARRPVRVQF